MNFCDKADLLETAGSARPLGDATVPGGLKWAYNPSKVQVVPPNAINSKIEALQDILDRHGSCLFAVDMEW